MSNVKPLDYHQVHVFDPVHNGADECECGLLAGADIHESDDAYDERMRPHVVNAPERIWLQTGCDDEVGEIDWKELSHPDVSWCAERIDNTDIEYVRADLLTTVRREALRGAANTVYAMSRIEARGKSIDFLNGAAWMQDKAAKLPESQIDAAATTEKGESDEHT